ncbi:MAG: LamG domain-containing protein [Candidatus Heimdallarchaeota archaeon]
MAGLDSNTKLLLHCNGIDESVDFPDVSDSSHDVTPTATAQVDTSKKKWGTGSLFLDGNSDYLTIPNSPDWNVYENNIDSWTVDFWCFTNAGNSSQVAIAQYQNGTNYWHIHNVADTGWMLRTYDGTNYRTYGYNGSALTVGQWYHVALIKVNGTVGLYINGTQITFISSIDNFTNSGSLYIGQNGAGSTYWGGGIDEVRVQKSNIFSATPNVGNTNTIVIPTTEYFADVIQTQRTQSIIIV